MKTIPTLIASVMLFSVFLISCGKDHPAQNNPVINPVADTHYLSKEIVVYSGTGDTTVVTFHYDNAKRLIKIADTTNYSTPFEYIGSTTYYYNGNDTFPYKSYHITTGSFIDTTTKFFYYDASGRKIKDSIILIFSDGANYQIYHTVNSFQYAVGKIYGYSVDSLVYTIVGPGTYRHVKTDTATLDANNYIVSNIKHEWDGSIAQTEITNTTSKNYMSLLSIRNCLDVLPDGYGGSGNANTSNNPSLIVDTRSGTGAGVYQSIITYTLDGDGYPTRISGDDQHTSPYTADLIYKPL